MRKIGRTFILSKCYGQVFNPKTKEIDDFYFEVYGNYTPKRATVYANRKWKDDSILIFNVEQEKQYYKISVEDFIKHGERVY